ncbi:synapse differentiation-inducing gene protein 1-like [Gigantopelta aegis]|uniref:synapse differentiation-inducing gene protein 1-like n=1 Tax=Gigantopelta aegis TaxID=1735272 RepID=UPI001B888A2D|nr:synapse differentiation-inducing gene protein 1-like [Gigantopelta aegis]
MHQVDADIPVTQTNAACLASYKPRDIDAVQLGMENAQSMFQERPTSHFKLSLFSCLCCLVPVGAAALYYSKKSRSAKQNGEWETASMYAKNAKDIAIVSICLGVFLLAIGIIIFGLLYSKIMTTNRS